MTKENNPSMMIKYFLAITALLILVYHMASNVMLIQGPMQHQIIHLGMMFLIVFGSEILNGKNNVRRVLCALCLIVGILATVYMRYNYDLLEDIVGFPEKWEMIVGVALVSVVIIGAWLFWGAVFPVLALILIAYYFWGHLLPGSLYHSKIDFDLGISNLSVGFSGIFGSLLAVMANFGVNLVIFGSLLEMAGANKFFLEVGKAAGKKMAGGPGQTAVVGSSLVGMVSGGAVGNVLITGSFTIPMMKKAGFKPETAGAIEAAASTGSQLMPPIMGIAAFMMAGFLNIDFSEIMIAGIVPSFLFYFTMAFGVQFIAKNQGIKSETTPIDREILKVRGPLFILPLAVLVYLLLNSYSAGIASFVVILLVLFLSLLRKKTRPSLDAFLKAVTKGMVMAAKITIAVAIVGILSQVFINTGLAQKLAAIIETISFGFLPLILFFTMILSLVLGLGLPATAAYALVAILIAPGLVQMGIEPIRAHFFAFYFAIVSAVTPPVALSSLAASSIAESNFMKTGLEAFKLSLPNFITPFLIIYNPAFLLNSNTTFVSGALSIVSASLAMLLMASVIYGTLFAKLSGIERMGILCSAISLFLFCISLKAAFLIAGLILGAIFIITNRKRSIAYGIGTSTKVYEVA